MTISSLTRPELIQLAKQYNEFYTIPKANRGIPKGELIGYLLAKTHIGTQELKAADTFATPLNDEPSYNSPPVSEQDARTLDQLSIDKVVSTIKEWNDYYTIKNYSKLNRGDLLSLVSQYIDEKDGMFIDKKPNFTIQYTVEMKARKTKAKALPASTPAPLDIAPPVVVPPEAKKLPTEALPLAMKPAPDLAPATEDPSLSTAAARNKLDSVKQIMALQRLRKGAFATTVKERAVARRRHKEEVSNAWKAFNQAEEEELLEGEPQALKWRDVNLIYYPRRGNVYYKYEGRDRYIGKVKEEKDPHWGITRQTIMAYNGDELNKGWEAKMIAISSPTGHHFDEDSRKMYSLQSKDDFTPATQERTRKWMDERYKKRDTLREAQEASKPKGYALPVRKNLVRVVLKGNKYWVDKDTGMLYERKNTTTMGKYRGRVQHLTYHPDSDSYSIKDKFIDDSIPAKKAKTMKATITTYEPVVEEEGEEWSPLKDNDGKYVKVDGKAVFTSNKRNYAVTKYRDPDFGTHWEWLGIVDPKTKEITRTTDPGDSDIVGWG